MEKISYSFSFYIFVISPNLSKKPHVNGIFLFFVYEQVKKKSIYFRWKQSNTK